MELKPQTLMVAIQCLAAETRRIEQSLEAESPENGAELEQLLVAYDLAADDLKAAYLASQARFAGFPSYDSLV